MVQMQDVVEESSVLGLCVCVDGHFGNSLHTSILMSSHKRFKLALGSGGLPYPLQGKGADSGDHCRKVGMHWSDQQSSDGHTHYLPNGSHFWASTPPWKEKTWRKPSQAHGDHNNSN